MDEHRVALLNPGRGQQMPRGATGQQQARGLLEAQRCGFVADVGRIDDHLLGVPATQTGGDHLVADSQRPGEAVHARRHRGDHARHLQAQRNRQLVRVITHRAAVRLVVERVGARRFDVDEHLPGSGIGQDDVLHRNHFGSAVAVSRGVYSLLGDEPVERADQLRRVFEPGAVIGQGFRCRLFASFLILAWRVEISNM